MEDATLCVYHRVPSNLIGSVLYPLNELKRVHPEAAATHLKKYRGREALLNRRIPHLDCLWNDALHLSAVHPSKIKSALEEARHILPPYNWFEIDAALLSPDRTVLWEYPESERARGDWTLDDHEVIPFDPGSLDRYSEVNARTRRYYARFKPGERFLLFVGIAHVLFKGSVEVGGLRVIQV